jgi:hypothetical protein
MGEYDSNSMAGTVNGAERRSRRVPETAETAVIEGSQTNPEDQERSEEPWMSEEENAELAHGVRRAAACLSMSVSILTEMGVRNPVESRAFPCVFDALCYSHRRQAGFSLSKTLADMLPIADSFIESLPEGAEWRSEWPALRAILVGMSGGGQ